ncbi:MAG: type II secretion system F family protein [Candidatus Thermoplasmatota archaeon]|nr:type II secretion system F family protein [Candidatus Thermoplasmatota archaeon]
MPLNKYQRLAYRLLGSSVDRSARSNAHLQLSLQKAHINMRPEVYLGYSYLNMIIVFGITVLLVAIAAGLAFTGVLPIPGPVFALFVPAPLILALVVYLLTFLIPDIQASTRARDIDAKLPYALNYMATMASAGVTPGKIFESLANQPLYGEVAKEAAVVSRDLNLIGRDLVTALTAAIDRSPSIRWQDLLQGAITSVGSGGDLMHYFTSKAEQYMLDNRQEQKKFLESLGVLAESYVTVVVAGPVFMIVLLTVMLMFGGSGGNMLASGYMLVLFLVPMAQLGFGYTIDFVTPEV